MDIEKIKLFHCKCKVYLFLIISFFNCIFLKIAYINTSSTLWKNKSMFKKIVIYLYKLKSNFSQEMLTFFFWELFTLAREINLVTCFSFSAKTLWFLQIMNIENIDRVSLTAELLETTTHLDKFTSICALCLIVARPTITNFNTQPLVWVLTLNLLCPFLLRIQVEKQV